MNYNMSDPTKYDAENFDSALEEWQAAFDDHCNRGERTDAFPPASFHSQETN